MMYKKVSGSKAWQLIKQILCHSEILNSQFICEFLSDNTLT